MSGGGGLYAGEIDCLVSRLLVRVRWLVVIERDELLDFSREIRPWCLILNTNPNNQPGKHWLALYKPIADGIELFASFGLSPRIDSLEFLDPLHLSFFLQSLSSSVCAHNFIVYIYLRSRNNLLSDIVYLFTKISSRDL